MNADAFRYLYEYHFSENRKLWDKHIMALSQTQFTQSIAYSVGSIRNQVVHLMDVDEAWFTGLRGAEFPAEMSIDENDRHVIRTRWDAVENDMRAYLAMLRDEMLFTKPLEGEDENLVLWQVLLQVINHGTDHRAQILRAIHDLGFRTPSQDFIFYVYDQLKK